MVQRFLIAGIAFLLQFGTLPTLIAAEPTGTWVREVAMPETGNIIQAVLVFKGDRLTVRFAECGYTADEKKKAAHFEFECQAMRSSDGYVMGRIIGVEMDLKNAPHELGMTVESLKGLNKVYGEPFCFRCETRDKVLTVADLRLPTPDGLGAEAKGMRDAIVACVSGKYQTAQTDNIPLPTVEKTKKATTVTTATYAWLTMPRQTMPRQTTLEIPARPRQTIIPTAADLAPPGTLKSDALLPLIADGWKQSTEPNDSTKIPPLKVPAEQPKQPGLIPPLPVPAKPPAKANPEKGPAPK
ncbi:MAG: hypothetical protein U0798_21530 [Gemmataceae bacterium]